MTMIHYHGTPVAGSRQDVARALMGRHALVPYPRPDDLPVVAEVCQSFVLDNGAYSVWKKGDVLDVQGYIEWVERWHRHPAFDWAIIPDAIEGDEAENDALLREWPAHLQGVPVWHLHESLGRLVRLGHAWPCVAIGGSDTYPTVGTATWWRRISEAMDGLCDEHGRPPCKLHGLRMLDPAVFGRLPLASADSINASRSCGSRPGDKNRFGMYEPPTQGQRFQVIAERIEVHQSAATWQRIDQQDLFVNPTLFEKAA